MHMILHIFIYSLKDWSQGKSSHKARAGETKPSHPHGLVWLPEAQTTIPPPSGNNQNAVLTRSEQKHFVTTTTGEKTEQQSDSLCPYELCPNGALTEFIYL